MEKKYSEKATAKVAQVKKETIDFLLQYSRVLRQIQSNVVEIQNVKHFLH